LRRILSIDLPPEDHCSRARPAQEQVRLQCFIAWNKDDDAGSGIENRPKDGFFFGMQGALRPFSIPLVISTLTMPPSLGLEGKLLLRGRKVGLESPGGDGEAGWAGGGRLRLTVFGGHRAMMS